MGTTPTTLKRSERRTVTLKDGVVVKRYHHPDPVARLFDHMRARNEHDVLRELARRGLSVPAPIEVRHVDGAWELLTEWIEGAASLEDALAGRAPWPAPREVVATVLGELLARAHAIGLDHPDLHAGNVLVRAEPGGCRAWIVDVRRARVRRRLSVQRIELDLARVAGSVRETLRPGFRSRFLLAYLRTLPAAIAGNWPDRTILARRIEAGARIARRDHVFRQRLRWTRASSVARPFEEVGRRGFRAIAIPEGPRVVVRDLPWRELREVWYSAARLCEHGLPSVRPVEIVAPPEPFAVFAPADHTVEPGELRALLEDRALSIEPLAEDSTSPMSIGPLVGARLVDRE